MESCTEVQAAFHSILPFHLNELGFFFILLPLFSSRIDSKLNYYKLLSSLPFADISQKTSHLVSFCFRYFNRVPKYSTKYDPNMSTLNFKIF